MADMSQKAELKRELGLFEVTLSGVGIILGAGIYALIGEAAGRAGNAVWMAFAVASLIAMFTGLSYAELSSMFPKANAEYEYTYRAFNQKLAFVVGWLVIFSSIISASTVALGFGGYFKALTGVAVLPSALILIVFLSIILLYGIKESVWFGIAFTFVEVGGLVFIILIGIPHLGHINYLEMPYGLGGVFKSAALIFFAYMGFEEMVKLSEETKSPEKTIPKGLIMALMITILLYILVALSAVSILDWRLLSASEAPFSEVAFVALGSEAFAIMSIIALFATANTVLFSLLAGSRITYGMARSFILPRALSKVDSKRKVPWMAVLMSAFLSMGFVFTGDIAFVASANDFVLFVTFMVINASLIAMRYKDPQRPRAFRVPISAGKLPLLPLLGIATCVFLSAQLDPKAVAMGSILVLTGVFISHFCCQKARAR